MSAELDSLQKINVLSTTKNRHLIMKKSFDEYASSSKIADNLLKRFNLYFTF